MPATRDAFGIAVAWDPETDSNIPRRVFTSWIPSTGPRAVVRALTSEERDKLQGRADALAEALRPFTSDQSRKVRAEIAAMLGGFRSMRHQEEDVDAVLDVLERALAEFPLWAIARASLLIAQRKAGLKPGFPPNDEEIYGVVEGVVLQHREAYRVATAVLAAPVEPPEPGAEPVDK